ncbi:hypothetical protein ES703_85333 [subsurface metagenome]
MHYETPEVHQDPIRTLSAFYTQGLDFLLFHLLPNTLVDSRILPGGVSVHNDKKICKGCDSSQIQDHELLAHFLQAGFD